MIGLLLIVRDHAVEHFKIMRHCALIVVAHTLTHRLFNALGNASTTSSTSPCIIMRETAIKPTLEIEIDATDEGVRHFAVREDADLRLHVGVDAVVAHFAAFGDAGNDGRDVPGAQRRIAILAAKACEHQTRHILEEEILDHAIDRDVAQALQGLLAQADSAEAVIDELVDLLAVLVKDRAPEIRAESTTGPARGEPSLRN